MGKTLDPAGRAWAFSNVTRDFKKMITIEPIMDFDLQSFLLMIDMIEPGQINIGADSMKMGLAEPSTEKVRSLIRALEEKKYLVYLKKNLKRLLI